MTVTQTPRSSPEASDASKAAVASRRATAKAQKAKDEYHQLLRSLTAHELRAHAKAEGLVGATKAKKDEILDRLGVP